MVGSFLRFSITMIGVTVLLGMAVAARSAEQLAVSVTPAAAGRQLVRMSLPMPKHMVSEGQTLLASDGHGDVIAAMRPLTWYPAGGAVGRSVRRALVTFPYTFVTTEPVRFVLRPVPNHPEVAHMPVRVSVRDGVVRIVYRRGPVLTARLIAPARTSDEPATTETVESNAYFLWQRTRMPDPQWPRVIEVRVDALGGVTAVAHLQRNLAGDAYAPDLGWEIRIERGPHARLISEGRNISLADEPLSHSFASGAPCELLFDDGRYRLYHPAAPLKRRGRVDVSDDGDSLRYRYLRCISHEKVPMQQSAWQRAEFVVAPAAVARLTPALQYPHQPQVDWRLWDQLYHTGPSLDLTHQPQLAALLRYHHDAVVHSMAVGDDWGNVTGYADGGAAGAVFGMNRLNHCAAIFEEAWRSGDRRLLEVALLWCDNFYDQSIWWGPGETGGTRYNNVIAMGRTPPDHDQSYMWRSNSAVSFCTKGFESFLLAYEETGDPRMLEALEAQVRYARDQIHADRGEARNIGDARDFVRLYELTGERRYLNEALRLFRELRIKLSSGDLFSQSGDPIEPDPPFIDEDATGYKHPFAKPYIIGYALAGLPGLVKYAPQEPKLRDVVQAVADFLAEREDPLGGWRYPHPRSSRVIMSQAMEHAWQLMQADEAIGAQERHLDAIERVLRQRIQGWLKTGKVFDGLTGWEWATGRVKQSNELYAMYKRPADRDFTRDYAQGQAGFGSSAPEGLVYFPDVLRFYLAHRPASRLLAPPGPQEPLGKVLARVEAKSP
jgi:hypothetical protein